MINATIYKLNDVESGLQLPSSILDYFPEFYHKIGSRVEISSAQIAGLK